jgi:hypothetical protein
MLFFEGGGIRGGGGCRAGGVAERALLTHIFLLFSGNFTFTSTAISRASIMAKLISNKQIGYSRTAGREKGGRIYLGIVFTCDDEK